ncbi:MAG TPA: hypothetical protein VLK84_26855 [Longimicrobium sp.]|nr:hypothetical protein [Longimicrobium sp.]
MTTTSAWITALLVICLPHASSAQQPILIRGFEEVAETEFTIDLEEAWSYAARYHFGESEGESNLSLEVDGDRVTGTLDYGEVQDDTAWVIKQVRFEGRIEGAMLIAPGWSGVFVRWKDERGLVLFRTPSPFIQGTQYGSRIER